MKVYEVNQDVVELKNVSLMWIALTQLYAEAGNVRMLVKTPAVRMLNAMPSLIEPSAPALFALLEIH